MIELVKDKVYVKCYDRRFNRSTHYYTYDEVKRQNISIDEVIANHNAVEVDIAHNLCMNVQLCVMKQVHSADLLQIDSKPDHYDLPICDSLITTHQGLVLGVQTADCVPVLLSTDDGEAVAAVHCGWKSAKENIIEKTIAKIRNINNRRIYAVIGPSIKQESYEVDIDFYRAFINDNNDNEQYFIAIENAKFLFDICGYVAGALRSSDVFIQYISEDNTYSMPLVYPSNRFSYHRNEKFDGFILSTIVKLKS